MPNIKIRFAAAEDAGLLLQLIRELAVYEKLIDEVTASEADLRRYGFGPERRFEALIASLDGEPVGYALFLPDFSTFSGRPGLFLEDIYIREPARRCGVGRRLLARLAAIAVERGCPALNFHVLTWNPAQGFYRRLGFALRDAWQPWGANGEAVRRLAQEDREER
ncbi:MAG: GNAT family N-acetyltransferase [Stellaceae bacterium]